MNRSDTSASLPFRLAVAVPALVAMGVSAYLTVIVLSVSGLPAGCGDGEAAFGCSDVLTSRWSKWIGIPVSAPAAGLYLTAALASVLLAPRFSASLRRIAWSLLLALALTAAGAALWFVGLQLLDVEEICRYCMTVHGCGVVFAGLVGWRFFRAARSSSQAATKGSVDDTVADTIQNMPKLPGHSSRAKADSLAGHRPAPGLAVVSAIVALTMLIGGQLIFRPKTTQVIDTYESVAGADDSTTSTKPSDDGSKVENTALPKPRPRKILNLLGGRTFVDLNEQMILGSPDAEFVVVKLFDYTCSHCRIMHRHLEQARERYGDRLAIVLAPVPLNTACNRVMRSDLPDHQYACLYARLARAVWRRQPERFAELHEWLMQGSKAPGPAETRRFVEKILGADGVDEALLDRDIGDDIGKCVDLWAVTAKAGQANRLPQLFLGNSLSLIRGESNTAAELFESMESILGIKPQAVD